MTTVQSMPGAGQEHSLLNDIPSWKRDLIQRKRSTSRVHGNPPTIRNSVSNQKVRPPFQSSLVRSVQGECKRSGQGDAMLCSLRGGSKFPQSHHLVVPPPFGKESSCDASNLSRSLDGALASANGVEVSCKRAGMHNRGLKKEALKIASDELFKMEDEELSYGPGIVSKLKNRYMSLAMRETRSRPPLRKFSSLEDLLDEPIQDSASRSRSIPAKSRPDASRKETMKRTHSMDSLTLRKTDSYLHRMSKGQSSNGHFSESLVKQDIIIIERTPSPLVYETPVMNGHSSPDDEDPEYPPQDTVKLVKKIFENTNGSCLRGAATKIASSCKASHSINVNAAKPAVKTKPAGLMARRAGGSGSALPGSIDEAKNVLKQAGQVSRPGPRSTLAVKAVPAVNGVVPVMPTPVVGATGFTPIVASVTAPVTSEHLEKEDTVKEAASASCRSAVCSQFSLEEEEDANEAALPVTAFNRASSPLPASLPPSPVPSHRVKIPSVFQTKESQRVEHENRKNEAKSRTAPPPPQKEVLYLSESSTNPLLADPPPKCLSRELPSSSSEGSTSASETVPSLLPEKAPPAAAEVSPSPAAEPESLKPNADSASAPPPRSALRERDQWHQKETTSLVFNFTSSEKATPSYLENDGVDLSSRKRKPRLESGYVLMPGFDGRSSSTDPEDQDSPNEDDGDGPLQESLRPGVTPSPSGVIFEGEAVIINGRSNLQRQPKTKKFNISFDDSATTTYEYPSETSLAEEMSRSEEPTSSQDSEVSSSMQGGLATYMPSKILLATSFELGVAPATGVPTVSSARKDAGVAFSAPSEGSDYLRPADESETVSWSSEGTSDMLF